ncbi:metallophosphoesterase [Myxococcus sp. AM011]|nr:metallophosphoesterase [Myxococcus sp. AM011]
MRSWVPWLLVLCAGCDVFELHPYEVRGGVRDTNARAVERLERNVSGGAFRFAVLGDIGVYQDDTVDAVRDIARRDVDFVVQMGDLTEFSSAQEYHWVADLLGESAVPTLAVIGNHDLLGQGKELFLHHFGPTFLSFEHGGSRFILFDSNSREYGFPGNVPDLEQLRSALGEVPGGGHLFTFSHVPPGHADFDASLTEPIEQLQAERGVSISFHGHSHRFSTDARRGVRYFCTDALEIHSYLVVTVEGDSVNVEQVSF